MTQNKEVWKDINGYEGMYQVSNLGRVKSLPRKSYNPNQGLFSIKGGIRKSSFDKDGYEQIILSKDGHNKCWKVHRLVAINFIPNPNNYSVINHKDEIKINNHVDNLEWCTILYNVNYGDAISRQVTKRSKVVEMIDIEGNVIKEYPSISSTSKDEFQISNVSLCCNGKQDVHKGFKWRFKK